MQRFTLQATALSTQAASALALVDQALAGLADERDDGETGTIAGALDSVTQVYAMLPTSPDKVRSRARAARAKRA